MTKASDITFQILSPENLPALYRSFNQIFGNGEMPYWHSREELLGRFKRVGLDLSLSAGAYINGEMIGFILTGLQKDTAYNAGTGILKEFRGSQIARQLYLILIEHFQKFHLKRCLLEVETNNEPARKLYTNLGFTDTRLFFSYRLSRTLPARLWERGFQLVVADPPDIQSYTIFSTVRPSFLQSWPIISNGLATDKAIEVYYRSELVGASVFTPGNGQVHFIGVLEEFRRRLIGYQLVRAMQGMIYGQRLHLLNVPEEAVSMSKFLKSCGFVSILQQIEMEKELV